MAERDGAPPPRDRIFGRLRFDGELEREFCDYYFRHALPYTRLALVLAILLYALFGILDLFIVPNVARSIWFIRYAVFCPVALVMLGLTFSKWFNRIMQPALTGLAVVCGLGIVAMIAIADAADGYLYYAGLLLVIPWSYTLLQLRFAYATAACATIMAGYEFVAIAAKSTPLEILINNNFFFMSAVIISMVAGYVIERGLRTEFLQRRVIERQRAELADHNVQLNSALKESLDEVRQKAAELQASRARIVATADAERRRIERNLHDGAQQHLTALRVRMGLAARLLERDPQRAKALLDELSDQIQETVDEVRNLAHGIYPPLLMAEGLGAALEAAASRSTLPTSVVATDLRRYPPEVEATVYFCCLEALQNACKYAGEGAAVTIRVEEKGSALLFEVVDAGRGFDSSAAGGGAGFVNMGDRLGALGGTLEVQSSPGRGTRVAGAIPISTFPGMPAATPDAAIGALDA